MDTASQMPRFRTDLVTTPVEEAGQRFIDVTDPDSGSTFRFYEVEYAIACAMEGNLDVDGLAKWALEELGLETSTTELATVITTLDELGYLEGGAPPAPASAAMADIEVEADEIELGAPGGTSSVVESMPVAPAAAASDFELGAPGKSPIARTRPDAPPAASIELGTPGLAASAGAGGEQSFEGLLDDEPPTAVRPTPVRDDAPTAIRPAPPPIDDFGLDGLTPPPAEVPSPKLRPVTEHPLSDDDGPTNLPPAIPGLSTDEPEVSVDLSEHLSIDAADVKEAVRQSQVMTAVSVPDELLAEIGESTSGDDSLEVSMEADSAPAEVDAAASRPVELPSEPVHISEPAPAVEAEPPPPEPASSGVSGVLLFLLLLAIAGGGAYWYFMIYKKKGETTGATAPPVAGQPGQPGKPGVPPTPPKPPAIKASIEKRTAESTSITMPKAGLVVFLPEDGAEVAAGDVVVRIKGYERFEKKIKEVTDRREYYQRKLDGAKEKLAAGDATQQKNVDAFTRKVTEKTEKIQGYTEDLAKLQVTAPTGGKVKVVGKAGWLKEGEALLEIPGPSSLFAVFTLPAGKSATEGSTVEVAPDGEPDAAADCQVVAVAGDKVTVECQLDSGLPATGEVVLQP